MISHVIYKIFNYYCKGLFVYLFYLWCKTLSLTLRKEYALRLSENGVLRRIFGRKRDEVTGEWKKLHNEELHDLYSSQNIKDNEVGGTCGTHGRG
jgi:hypothetical protein